MEQNPYVKRPKTSWKDFIKKNVESIGGGSNWKEKATDRDGWRTRYEMGWVLEV